MAATERPFFIFLPVSRRKGAGSGSGHGAETIAYLSPVQKPCIVELTRQVPAPDNPYVLCPCGQTHIVMNLAHIAFHEPDISQCILSH